MARSWFLSRNGSWKENSYCAKSRVQKAAFVREVLDGPLVLGAGEPEGHWSPAHAQVQHCGHERTAGVVSEGE